MANFLFLDESYSAVTKIAALTGIVVPMASYPFLREQFYKTMPIFARADPGVVHFQPRELHASALFKDEPAGTDEERHRAFDRVVDLIIDHRLNIYRIGFVKTKTTGQFFADDHQLVGLCWSYLLQALQPEYDSQVLVPVMDGFDERTIAKLSASIQFLDIMRVKGLDGGLSLRHTENILGEMFYADSKYSIFIQVADMVAYLRATIDLADTGCALTPYRSPLLEIARRIPSELLTERVSRIYIADDEDANQS